MSDNTPGNVAAQADDALGWQVRLLNLVFGVLAWLPLWVWVIDETRFVTLPVP